MSSRLQDIAMKRKINSLIKLLSEASETPATITPDLNTFDQQLTQAPDATQISVPNKDLTFAKRDGQWFVTGAGISDGKLRSILLPAGQKKLDLARQDTNVNFEAADFIEPVKAVNFTRDQPGAAWRDNTPIEPAIIKKYMFGAAVGDIGVSAATPGNALVHRDDNLNYVLLGSTFNIMAPGRDLSATNPLEAAKQLLIRAGFDSQFNITSKQPPTNFIDIIDNKEELSLNLDRLGEAGALRDALRSVRTLVGKFADLFNQDDIKVNFEVTEFGPALTRRKVAGRSTEALTASDARKLEKTNYFKYEQLPSTGQAKYKIGKNASETAEVDVEGETVKGLDDVIDPAGATITNTFGSALYLYIKGRLKFAGETQYSATPAPASTPADKGQTPQEQWEAYIKILLTAGDWGWTMTGPNGRPGGLFFEFNADKSNKEIPDNYISATNTKIQQIKADFETIFKDVEPAKKPASMGISVLAIATGDPIGSPAQNMSVSNRRVKTLAQQIDKSMGDVLTQPAGETPWASNQKLQNLSAATASNKKALRGARFGTTIFKRTTAQIDPNDIARKFYEVHSASLDESIGSYRANLINEIRRIIKETK